MTGTVDVDIGAMLDAGVAARIDAARRRRKVRDDFQRAHVQRREYGNRVRHATKLARQASQSQR